MVGMGVGLTLALLAVQSAGGSAARVLLHTLPRMRRFALRAELCRCWAGVLAFQSLCTAQPIQPHTVDSCRLIHPYCATVLYNPPIKAAAEHIQNYGCLWATYFTPRGASRLLALAIHKLPCLVIKAGAARTKPMV